MKQNMTYLFALKKCIEIPCGLVDKSYWGRLSAIVRNLGLEILTFALRLL